MPVDAPLWVTAITGLGAGLGGSLLAGYQARKTWPVTRRQMDAQADRSESEAVKAAMDTVEEALNVARARIENLQTQIVALTSQIGEMRESLRVATTDRSRIDEALNIALTERAKLQQQLMDINRRLGARRVADLTSSPADAIVMVSLETGEIVYANDGIYPLLGYVPSQIIGHPLGLLIPDAQRARHQELRINYTRHPEVRAMGRGLPLYARPNGGGQVPVDISLHPTGDGRVIALIKRREDQTPPAQPQQQPAADVPLTAVAAAP